MSATTTSEASSQSSTLRSKALLWLQVSILVIVSIPIRLWKLEELPRFFGWEHDWFATHAAAVLRGEHQLTLINALFFTNGAYLDNLTPHLFFADFAALSIGIFGYNFLALKLVPTVFGLLGVWMVYYYLARWSNKNSAFWGAFLMATAPEMIGLSRDLHACVTFLIPYGILVAHALMLTLETPSRKNFLFSIVLASFSLHLYQAAYILPLLLALGWSYRAIVDRNWRYSALKSFLCCAPVGALVALPVVYYQLNPKFHRQGTLGEHLVGNFLAGNSYESRINQIETNLSLIWQHFISDGRALFFSHGVTDYTLLSQTVLLPAVSFLFFVGCLIMLTRIQSCRFSRVTLGLAFLGLVPAVFSLPMTRRLVIFDGILFAISGYAISSSWGKLQLMLPVLKNKGIEVLLGGAVCLVLGYQGINTYSHLASSAPRYPEREFSEHISELLKQQQLIITTFGTPGISGTVEYLTGGALSRQQYAAYFMRPAKASDLNGLENSNLPLERSTIGIAIRRGSVMNSECSFQAADDLIAQISKSAAGWNRQLLGTTQDSYLIYNFPPQDVIPALTLAKFCLAK